MKTTVIGGGNGSFAAAVDITLRGHKVSFWRRDPAALGPARAAGGIELKDFEGTRFVPLAEITSDLGQAVEGAELIVAPIPAFGQEDLAKALAPYLSDGQVIYLPPGTFGSYVMMKALREAGCTADVAIAETGTLPWLCRKHGDNLIAITTRATRLPTGVFPARHSERALAVIEQAFPGAIEPVEDALSGALMNAGPIIHPPLIVMNAGPIQHFEHWDIHNEGTQPTIRAVTTTLDGERIAVREALGYAAPHFPLADHYSADGDEWMYGALAHDKLTDSGDWREKLDLYTHRYMREDLALGLGFIVSVGRWLGTPTPVAAGLFAIGGAMVGEDFEAQGRTLEKLGLAALNRQEMIDLLREGI
ncbi:NAD/NADP-dependent octopine/nopaline dehydrogenase family protein [Amorphus orientalis]|uniref:Opine dehydrogenase n=1 Tax=Amorphus orientalis TaxID=649198 RepID=A0AAE3VPE9_9HYPH|nr:NAD/NADP-dependent octopine/nopaline dehydrogenase family protein [Amorphus orientalis]MDQ0315355.1 opine dehydrogenase [Amorphus orientalis]